MSQEQVARAADLTVNAYGKIERARATPSWPTVRAIAGALDVALKQLGGEVDNQHQRVEETASAA
ncbi:MAG TPA: helix-turn-helix transcriptional regulator [Thermoleophilaceae bacterium]